MKNCVQRIALAAALLAALMVTACPDPTSDNGTDPGGPLTAIAIDPAAKTITVGQEFTLTLTKTPSNGTGTIEWSSADASKVTVTGAGVIKGIAVTTTPVTITAQVAGSEAITAICAVSVSEALELKLITNAAVGAEMADESEPTLTLPEPQGNIYAINSYYTATTSKLPDSSSGFKDATFVYIDKQLSGDFKFRVRARMTTTPAANSTAKGIVIGAFTPLETGGPIGETSKAGGIVYRCSGGSGSSPYAIRSMVSKPNEQGSVGGLNTTVGKTDEYIFEVIRTEDGYKTTVFISKNNEELATATVNYTDRAAELGAAAPVYAGLAFAAVKAEISQIALWIDNLDGDPAYYSGDSAAAAVNVAAIKIGVQGAAAGAVTGTGTADSPAAYIARAGEVTSGIQLVPQVIPSYADITTVKYYLSLNPTHTNDPTITVNETTGLVSVTGAGTATIQAISDDIAEPEFYLTITVTPDYVPVEDFNIVATPNKTTIIQDIETLVLSTDIPATVTSPVITWTTGDEGIIMFVTGTGDDETTAATVTGPSAKIKGLEAGTATITASAVTTNGETPTTKTATLEITVSAGGDGGTDVFWNFSEAAFTSLDTTINTETTVNGLTILATSDKTITTEGSNKTVDEIEFTNRLKTGGAGDPLLNPTARAFKLVVSGPCTISLYIVSSSSSANREIAFSNGTSELEVKELAGASNPIRLDYTYAGAAGDVFIYSKASGINLYGIMVDYQ